MSILIIEGNPGSISDLVFELNHRDYLGDFFTELKMLLI